jgi:hypothetical protein
MPPTTFTPTTSTPVESSVAPPTVAPTTRSPVSTQFYYIASGTGFTAPVSTPTKQTITFPLKSPPTTATNIFDYLGRSREQHNEEKKEHQGLLDWLFQNPAQTEEGN